MVLMNCGEPFYTIFVWDLADLFMAIMAVINLLAILILWKVAKTVFKDYMAQRKQGKNSGFNKKNVPNISAT